MQNALVLAPALSPVYSESEKKGFRKAQSTSLHAVNSLKRFFGDTASAQQSRSNQSPMMNKQQSLQQLQRKLVPRNINIEKESLYEQVILHKQQVNQLKQENISLRTSNSGYESQFTRFNNLSSPIIDQPDQYQHIAQILTYQKELKTKNEMLRFKEQQILKIKQSTQYHRLDMLQDEIDRQNKEIIELKYMLDQKNRIDQNLQGTNTVEALDVLTADNIEMAAVLQSQISQINQFQAICKGKQTKIFQLQVKCQGMKGIQLEQQKEVDQLRKRDPIGDMNQKINTLDEIRLKAETEKQSLQIQKMLGEFNQSQKRQSELERRIKEVQQDLTQKYTQIDKEKQFFKEMSDRYGRENQQLNEKVKSLEKALVAAKVRKSTLYVQGFDEQTQSSQKILINIPEVESKNYEKSGSETDDVRVLKVQKQQVRQQALLLKYKLRSQKIQMSELDKVIQFLNINLIQYFFRAENIHSGNVSISELDQALQGYPFSLDDHHQRRLFVRYLIENNPKNEFIFDEELTASISQVRSVFKTLLSNYQLFTAKEVIMYMEEINQLLQQNQILVVDFLSKKPMIQEQYSFEDLLSVFQKQEIPFSLKHLDFMVQVLYDRTNNIDFFKLEEFFQYFSDDKAYTFNFI